ncbi:MAG: glycosyltransferase [Candidatus Gastranaerophilales bacterium]|nr:glycosyltransferase [Candidatus Gastranaerophilales bacterium]
MKSNKDKHRHHFLGHHGFIFFYMLLVFGLFYIGWRWLFTLNLMTSPFTTFWSYALLFAEAVIMFVFTGFSLLMIKADEVEPAKIDNKLQQDYYKDFYHNGELISFKNYKPSVDIFICTYNEDEYILVPTIMAANNINYPDKKVYVLDDGNRKEIKELCKKLGCNYITRDKNTDYKAGNINNALAQTNSDLVVVFDADHKPVSTFLRETVYYFADESVALVQTPQYFLNLDAVQKNLNMPNFLSNEQDIFYNVMQPGLSKFDAVFCGGTNIIIRRKTLEDIGGFPSGSVTEDSLLGLIFHAKKLKVIYYNKPLAVGIAAGSFNEYMQQRNRWTKGNLQIVKNPANWKYYLHLNFGQLFFYFLSALYFLNPVVRMILLLTPVFFLVFNVSTILIVFYQVFLFQVSYLLLKFIFLFTDKVKRGNVLLADMYELIVSIFNLGVIFKTLFLPKKLQDLSFRVTNKNIEFKNKNIKYKVVLTIILFVLIYAQIQGVYDLIYGNVYSVPAVYVNLFWNLMNIIMIIMALRVVFDRDESRKYIRLPIDKRIVLTDCKGNKYDARVLNVSLGGLKFVSGSEFKDPAVCALKVEMNGITRRVNLLSKRLGSYRGVYMKKILFRNLTTRKIHILNKFINFAFEKLNIS